MEQITLKTAFESQFDIDLTPLQANQIITLVAKYELRDEHPQAFNSPYLGVNKAYFFPKDATALFDILNIDKAKFSAIINKTAGINTKFKVTGNDFNLLCVWLVYCIKKGNLPEKLKMQTSFSIMTYLNYKFFTGKVATMLPHGANPAVMEATIENLSMKCDIKHPETSTWKAIIYDHVTQLLSNNSIHKHTLDTFTNDKDVVYVLSDLHTRLSTKIINVVQEYYKNNEAGIRISSTDATQLDAEGQRKLRDLKATLDNTVTRIATQALNLNSFINIPFVELSCKLATDIRKEALVKALEMFSSIATVQMRSNEQDKKINIKNQQIIIGYRLLISYIVQKTYRYCILMGVDADSNVKMLECTRNIYKASRISDPDILVVKDSVDYFLREQLKITRDATRIAVRGAFILYIMCLSFQ